MVHAYKKGKLKKAPKKIMEVAEHISDEDARDFAKTKHDGLEEKKEKKNEKKAFDFKGIMEKLEKLAAGTKVVVYENDRPNEFDSITEAAAFITSKISRGPTVSQVKEMLSQRQTEIFGMKVEYPSSEQENDASGQGSGVQDLASMFKGLTGSYGSGLYGSVKLSSVLSKKATDKVDESMFLPREGEITDRHRQVAKLLVDLFNKHKKSPEIRPVGTLSRSSVGYDQLTKKDLEGAGFLPSLIAVPEKGQSQLTTYRHPLNGLHFHRHDDNWLFHDDTYASMQMLIKKYQIEHPGASRKDVLKFALKDAIPKSMGHIVHEGSPGYVNYIYGSILGKPGFIEGGNPTAARKAKGVLGAVGGVMGASRMLTGKWNPITSAGIAGGFLGSTALSNIIGNAVGAQPPGWKNTILRAGLPIAGTIASAVGAHKLQKAWNESVERNRREKERRRRLKERIRQQALKKRQMGKAASAGAWVPTLAGAGLGAAVGALSSKKHKLRNAIIGTLTGSTVGSIISANRFNNELNTAKQDAANANTAKNNLANAVDKGLRRAYEAAGYSYPERKGVSIYDKISNLPGLIENARGVPWDYTALMDDSGSYDAAFKEIRGRLPPNIVKTLEPVMVSMDLGDPIRLRR